MPLKWSNTLYTIYNISYQVRIAAAVTFATMKSHIEGVTRRVASLIGQWERHEDDEKIELHKLDSLLYFLSFLTQFILLSSLFLLLYNIYIHI